MIISPHVYTFYLESIGKCMLSDTNQDTLAAIMPSHHFTCYHLVYGKVAIGISPPLNTSEISALLKHFPFPSLDIINCGCVEE